MRIDFVYVETTCGKVPVNPEALEYILGNNSSTGGGSAELHMRSGKVIFTNMSVERVIRAFSPMNIAV